MKVKYYLTSSGRSPVEEFLQEQSVGIKADFFDAISLLAEGAMLSLPLSRPLFNLHHGLYELRLKDRAGQVRFFYYIKRGEAVYLLHGFRKKTQELPQREIDLVTQRLKGI